MTSGPEGPSARVAAAAACAAMEAAVECVHHGALPGPLLDAAVAAATAAGVTDIHLDVHLAPARCLSLQLAEELRKADFVLLRLRGTCGSPFAIARTTVVGFDTLPEDLAAADCALAGLVGGSCAAVPGTTTRAIAHAVRTATGRPCAVVVDPLSVREGSAGRVDSGDVVYIEVTITAGHAHQGARLGDMVQIAPGGGITLTTLASRLWL